MTWPTRGINIDDKYSAKKIKNLFFYFFIY